MYNSEESCLSNQVLQQDIKVKRKKRHFLAGCAFDLANLSALAITQALCKIFTQLMRMVHFVQIKAKSMNKKPKAIQKTLKMKL